MRVIAGKYKSIKLNSVDGMNTRPTTDKIKENLFNMLECEGRVLDLFGGTGGLGIESLSRGASHVTFIDGSNNAIKVICSNIDKCKIPKSDYDVYRNDFKRALKILGKKEEKYDLIFLDPQYDKGLINQAITAILENNVCNEGCLVVCEKSVDEVIESKFKNLELVKEKKYGITNIIIFEYMEN